MVFVVQEIFNVTRRYQNSVVKCQAQNVVGAGVDAQTLDVICTYSNLATHSKHSRIINEWIILNLDPPSFKYRPENVEAEMNENITLSCIVDANPPPDIIWVFDPIDRVTDAIIYSIFLQLCLDFSRRINFVSLLFPESSRYRSIFSHASLASHQPSIWRHRTKRPADTIAKLTVSVSQR